MKTVLKTFGWLLAFVLMAGLALLARFLLSTPLGQPVAAGLNALFAADSTQLWWFVTRSAGIIAYLLLWLSTVWGLVVPSKLLAPVLENGYTFDFHQFISLLALGFVALHIGVLLVDRYLPYNLWQILIPFLSAYRPGWVGLGVISLYVLVLVTVTFYMRARIGMQKFRLIHYLSLAGYLGVTLHGFFAGTDSPLVAMLLMYQSTALVVVFLTVYWLVNKFSAKPKPKPNPNPVKAHGRIRR